MEELVNKKNKEINVKPGTQHCLSALLWLGSWCI